MGKPDREAQDAAVASPRLGPAAMISLALLTTAGAGATLSHAPVALWNTTPSEPEGLYLRSDQRPAPGAIVAFSLPPAAFAYADEAMPYLRRRSLLKAVAAGPGDLVCAGQGGLAINGAHVAPIAARDHLGRDLPHWNECRRLGADELFVFSARVPNSFDSRYFGPVRQTAVLGVYRLVAPAGGAGV